MARLTPDEARILADLYGKTGRRREALEILDSIKAVDLRNLKYYFASTYARLGDADQAMKLLEAAYEDREGALARLNVSRSFDVLRADPRFQDLLRRMDFPE